MAVPELTVAEPAPEPATPAVPERRTPPWGWLPPLGVLILAIGALLAYDVSPADIASFAAYILLAVTIPGTLLWRALRGGPGPLVADVAAGAVVGYAIEVLGYVAVRAAGVPRLGLVVPAAIILAFLAVPGLRRFWRGSGERVPLWWSGLVSSAAAFMVVWSAASFFRTHGLAEPANSTPYPDMPFHLALAGEVKHHVPPLIPYVRGEQVKYHWFVYADLSATTWGTGVELQTLLHRLSMLPMLLITVVLIAVLGRNVTGRWWAGVVALAITLFAVAPSPYGWIDGPISDAAMLGVLWLSPTQTFGTMLFLPIVLLLVDLLRREPGLRRESDSEPGTAEPGQATIGRWVLFTLVLAAVTGAKATFLPLLLGGLAVVLVGHAVARRRLHRTALAAFGLTLVALAFAQVVLFNGSDGGLAIEPLGTLREFGIDTLTGLTAAQQGLFGWPLILTLAISLFCWACIWAGAFGLFRRRTALGDPAHLLFLGIGAAGLGAALTFNHPGLAQLYFFQSARPYLALLAAAGLAVAIPVAEQRFRTALLLTPVLLAGIGAVWALRVAGDDRRPTRTAQGVDGLAVTLGTPFLVLIVLIAVTGLAVFLGRRQPLVRRVGLAMVIVLMFGFATQTAWARYAYVFGRAFHGGWRSVAVVNPQKPSAIPPGAVAAGRWLRDHSRVTDLVATNTHCRIGPNKPQCDSRHFWVSAYTERRVLLEGWAYTLTAHALSAETDLGPTRVPFWDQRLLAANEAAFQGPSTASIGRLRDGYGVRWLIVDTRFDRPPAALAEFATLRFQAGDCEVYELV